MCISRLAYQGVTNEPRPPKVEFNFRLKNAEYVTVTVFELKRDLFVFVGSDCGFREGWNTEERVDHVRFRCLYSRLRTH